MNSFHHIGEERELFKQIARRGPSRPWMDARSPSLSYVRHHVQFVLLAGCLGVAVALGSSVLVGGG